MFNCVQRPNPVTEYLMVLIFADGAPSAVQKLIESMLKRDPSEVRPESLFFGTHPTIISPKGFFL